MTTQTNTWISSLGDVSKSCFLPHTLGHFACDIIPGECVIRAIPGRDELSCASA